MDHLAQQHTALVDRLVKPGYEILGSLDSHKTNLLHAVLGIAGEAGELVDAIKKHAIYNKDLDHDNVIEELGDLEFYLQQLRSALLISRSETLENNILKLEKRYRNGYSDQAAQERADKKEGAQ